MKAREMSEIESQNTLLMNVFAQSWQYVRHAQTMFWQSFTALFAVIMGVLYFTFKKGESLELFGYGSAATLALVGYLVTMRAMIVIKEHLITINNVRLKCGLENLGVILDRWKVYDLRSFKLRRKETFYMLVALQIYVVVISVLVLFLHDPDAAFLLQELKIASLPFVPLATAIGLELGAGYFLLVKK